MDSMHGDSSVVTLMDGHTFHVRVVDCTNHMEMNGISTKLEGLTDICQLNVREPGCKRIISLRMKEYSCSIFISL